VYETIEMHFSNYKQKTISEHTEIFSIAHKSQYHAEWKELNLVQELVWV